MPACNQVPFVMLAPQALELLKAMCELPDMELDAWQKRWQAFDDRNGLCNDPAKEVGGCAQVVGVVFWVDVCGHGDEG